MFQKHKFNAQFLDLDFLRSFSLDGDTGKSEEPFVEFFFSCACDRSKLFVSTLEPFSFFALGYGVSLRIQSEWGKILNTDNFDAVMGYLINMLK